jgi:hypothetical protein
VAKHRAVGDVLPVGCLILRAPHQKRAIFQRQENRAFRADVEAVVEMLEVLQIDGRHGHPGKAAVRMVDPARDGNDPLAR